MSEMDAGWVSRLDWDFILNRSQQRMIRLTEVSLGSWDITEFWPAGEDIGGVLLFGPRGEYETRAMFEQIKSALCDNS